MATKKSEKKHTSTGKGEGKRKAAAPRAEAGNAGPDLGEGILDMDQAIRMLKTTRPTFYRWLRQGQIKGMKVGRQWRFQREDIERFLKGEEPRVELAADIRPRVADLQARLRELEGAGEGGQAEAVGGEDGVRQAAGLLICLAYSAHASDFHVSTQMLEPVGGQATGLIRLRVDGVLLSPITFDHRLAGALIQRFKIMANCDINEKLLPQDGRILIRLDNRNLDLRISFMPSMFGESVTVRVLDASAVMLDLERLPYAEEDRAKIRKALRAPNGLIIFTGPTGSGKTTTLYAALKELSGPERKVISIEQPVEYILPWVEQVGVNPGRGLTFARAMRSALRQAPNVVMIGELRDGETLQVAMEAALCGHLVLSAMHTQDAASALVRMAEMGTPPFVIASGTTLVCSQRLVRRICDQCKEPYELQERERELVAELARKRQIGAEVLGKTFYHGRGCDACSLTGYRRRTSILEVMEVNSKIRAAVQRSASAEEIRDIAIASGMRTLCADGIRLVEAGETTIEEVLRVLDVDLLR